MTVKTKIRYVKPSAPVKVVWPRTASNKTRLLACCLMNIWSILSLYSHSFQALICSRNALPSMSTFLDDPVPQVQGNCQCVWPACGTKQALSVRRGRFRRLAVVNHCCRRVPTAESTDKTIPIARLMTCLAHLSRPPPPPRCLWLFTQGNDATQWSCSAAAMAHVPYCVEIAWNRQLSVNERGFKETGGWGHPSQGQRPRTFCASRQLLQRSWKPNIRQTTN